MNTDASRWVFFPKWSAAIFLVLFIALAVFYDFDRILFEPPQSIHLWRQSDCLSLTLLYGQDHNPFLQPSMHYLGIDGSGKTMSEFPIIYYLVGNIWAIVGQKIWIYRALVLLLFFFGLLSIHKMVEGVVKNSFAGFFASLILFTSPVLVYYSNNFLMNIPAFSFACMGLYQFFRYRKNGQTSSLVWCCLFYSMAGLLKISSLLSFIPILIIYGLEFFKIPIPITKSFRSDRKESTLLLSVFLIPFLWFKYAAYYNSQHTGGIFLIGILPIWEYNWEQIADTWEFVYDRMKFDYLRPFIEISLCIISIITLIFWKHIDRSIAFMTGLTVLGCGAFLILFFQALKHHDYYIIDLYILIPLLLMSFFLIVQSKLPSFYNSVFFSVVLMATLAHSAEFASERIAARYNPEGWINRDYREIFQPFSELEPVLQELGIDRDARVFSPSDYSINISLYLMNRKGWTDYGVSMDPERITQKIELGAEYMFIANQKTKEHPAIQPYLKNKIGSHRNIEIYRLDP